MAYDVTKDVHPFVGSDSDVDFVLFFTDNKNEPKKINIRRCIEGDTSFTGNALGYSGEDLKDFVMACPKTPTSTIQFDFQFDPTRGESNFKNTNGIQFAYQNVYIDGFLSSLSGYSEVAYPDAIERLGAQSISQIDVENICNLSIPRGSNEVSRVRILFREGQENAWQIIDEVSAKVNQDNENFFFNEANDELNTDTPLGFYTFYNDKVYPIVSNDISQKNFDNLPKKAEAQAVADNRLMYGNYIDGFDPVICRSQGSVVFRERPKDLIDATLDVKTTFIFNEEAVSGPRRHGASCAFKIDSSGLPDVIPSGTYNLTINFRAEKNIHLYVAGNKYYGTTLVERDEGLTFEDSTVNDSFLQNGISDFNDPLILNAEGPKDTSVSRTLSFRGSLAGTQNQRPGVLSGKLKGRVYDQESDTNNPSTGVSFTMGSSPANPLIVPFASASINIVFSVDTDDLTADNLGLNISKILTGDNSGLTGMSIIEAPGVENIGDPVVLDHNIVTGIESGDRIAQTDLNSQLISCVVDRFGNRNHPLAFVILKSGNVKFSFESVSDANTGVLFFNNQGETNPQTSSVRFVRMIVDELNITKEDFVTCLPRPVKGRGHIRRNTDVSPSIAISDSTETLWGLTNFGVNTVAKIVWPMVPLDLGPAATMPAFHRRKDGSPVEISTIGSIGDGGANFPGGFDSTSLSGRSIIPAPIAEWFVFNEAAINNNDATTGTRVIDYYSLDIPSLSSNEELDLLAEIQGGLVVEGISLPYTYNDVVQFLIPPDNGGVPTSFSNCWQGFVDSISIAAGLSSSASGSLNFFSTDVSVVDGAAGPGGAGVDGASDDQKFSFELGERYRSVQPGNTNNQLDFTGPNVACSNKYGSVWSSTLVGLVDNMPYLTFKGEYLSQGDTIPAYSSYSANESTPNIDRKVGIEDLKSAPFNSLGSILQTGTMGSSIGSFKTRDTHDFGMVYYDQRGRASTVFPIESVYVPGYSDEERNLPGATKGPVSIRQKLLHAPPSWAERYKIVYSPASKISRFIQYSSGGAFINENQPTGAEDKIYVSLNYLQRKSISYSDAYGARDQDTGETTLYRFTPGDKLRVLSYYDDESSRVWADDVAVFDVVGQEEFLKDQDEHPFLDEADVTENLNAETQNPILRRTGSFVVLRNNKDANGFTALDIRAGTDKWGNRCVFEITSYKNDLSDDLQAYYETPYGGTVSFNPNAGRYQHSNTNIVIEYGDVFFRGLPVNFQLFNSDSNQFEDLIKFDDDLQGASSQSNFLNYYLESNSVTDLYRSQSKGYGKMHFYNPDAEERRHEASITFSEKTNVQSGNIFYTFFSPLDINFFDLDIDYGAINYMASIGNEMVSMQESKCSLLQVAKSMTTKADGTDDLVSSTRVLSSPRYFVDDVGTAGHAESVVVANDNVYFSDRNSLSVVSISPTGSMKILSDQNMSEFFDKVFIQVNSAITSGNQEVRNSRCRIIGGYDPVNDQFLVTIKTPDSSHFDSSSEAPELTTPGVNLPSVALLSNNAPVTIAYDAASETGWITRYSFLPTCYGHVAKDFVSYKISEGTSNDVLYRHNVSNLTFSEFYGKAFLSQLRSVFNVDLFKSKNFNTISIEPSHDFSVACRLTTKNESTNINRWKVYEDTEYSEIGRSSIEASSQYVSIGLINGLVVTDPVGKFTDVKGNIVDENFNVTGSEALCVDIKFKNNISQIAFNLNSYESAFDSTKITSETVSLNTRFPTGTQDFQRSLGFENIYLIPHRILSSNTIRFIARNNGLDLFGDSTLGLQEYQAIASSAGITVLQAIIENHPNVSSNSLLVVKSNPSIYGDKLRDKFAILDLTYNGNILDASVSNRKKPYALEISAVSVDVTESEFT